MSIFESKKKKELRLKMEAEQKKKERQKELIDMAISILKVTLSK